MLLLLYLNDEDRSYGYSDIIWMFSVTSDLIIHNIWSYTFEGKCTYFNTLWLICNSLLIIWSLLWLNVWSMINQCFQIANVLETFIILDMSPYWHTVLTWNLFLFFKGCIISADLCKNFWKFSVKHSWIFCFFIHFSCFKYVRKTIQIIFYDVKKNVPNSVLMSWILGFLITSFK